MIALTNCFHTGDVASEIVVEVSRYIGNKANDPWTQAAFFTVDAHRHLRTLRSLDSHSAAAIATGASRRSAGSCCNFVRMRWCSAVVDFARPRRASCGTFAGGNTSSATRSLPFIREAPGENGPPAKKRGSDDAGPLLHQIREVRLLVLQLVVSLRVIVLRVVLRRAQEVDKGVLLVSRGRGEVWTDGGLFLTLRGIKKMVRSENLVCRLGEMLPCRCLFLFKLRPLGPLCRPRKFRRREDQQADQLDVG